MKRTYYLRKEWRYNKPIPTNEKEIDKIIELQAVNIRAIDNKNKL